MKLLFSIVLVLLIIPSIGYGIDAKVETVEGDIFQITDFSMDGRRTFSVDRAGGIGRVDWKEITSFEIKQVGANYWVEVQFTPGSRRPHFLKPQPDPHIDIPFLTCSTQGRR